MLLIRHNTYNMYRNVHQQHWNEGFRFRQLEKWIYLNYFSGLEWFRYLLKRFVFNNKPKWTIFEIYIAAIISLLNTQSNSRGCTWMPASIWVKGIADDSFTGRLVNSMQARCSRPFLQYHNLDWTFSKHLHLSSESTSSHPNGKYFLLSLFSIFGKLFLQNLYYITII